MPEELGKIEKPPAADFKKGRKLLFVPLIYRTEDAPEEYLAIFARYWQQVNGQISDLAAKLGEVKRVYHELVAVAGDEGDKTVAGLNEASHNLVQACRQQKAQLEALEDADILSEFMDWPPHRPAEPQGRHQSLRGLPGGRPEADGAPGRPDRQNARGRRNRPAADAGGTPG